MNLEGNNTRPSNYNVDSKPGQMSSFAREALEHFLHRPLEMLVCRNSERVATFRVIARKVNANAKRAVS